MKYFGTDGIRGIYGQNLDEDLAYRAGLAASGLMADECFVGMDTRVSGESLFTALAEGLMQGGINVKKVGIVPTPAISFLSKRYNKGGIMISASHNPPEYNGIKFFSSTGYKMTAFSENSIEEYIDRPPARIGGGRIINYSQGREEYISRLLELSDDLNGKTVALDCAYGAASSVAEEVFVRCGAKVKVFCDESDGSKINLGVGALNPRFIEERAEGLIGFAFDGDADRLVVTDGTALDGDSVLFNLALRIKPKGVAGTIMNNRALEAELCKRGIKFIRTAVGDKNISEAMRRHSFTLGGEQSGHYIISPAVSGDALYAALTLCKSDKFIRLKLVPQYEASIESSSEILCDPTFIAAKNDCEKAIENGRLIVRMSGTEPKIRLMAEGDDTETIKRAIDLLSSIIKEFNKKEN